MAAGILAAFDFFLRTGELFTLRRVPVEFFAQQTIILQLTQTKSSTHEIHSQRLLAWDSLCVASLKFLCHDLLPSDLVPSSAVRFRILWHFPLNGFAILETRGMVGGEA